MFDPDVPADRVAGHGEVQAARLSRAVPGEIVEILVAVRRRIPNCAGNQTSRSLRPDNFRQSSSVDRTFVNAAVAKNDF